MSQITVENIKRPTETASRSTRGVAAAWVNFNGIGTVAVRDSENVASITDNAVGNYTLNFSNSMADGNYIFSEAKQNVSANTDFGLISDVNGRTTTSCPVVSIESGTLADSPGMDNVIHGDLA